MNTLWISLRMAVLMAAVLGLAYPLAMTGLSQWIFPASANGSLVFDGGKPVGSSLIGQDWSASQKWFQGRPSATGDHPYNPEASGGSNLTPVGKPYSDRVAAARADWTKRAQEASQTLAVPQALLTTSASGLDPQLDLQAALWQVPLVAKARKADAKAIELLVKNAAEPIGWPWDPEPYVNLLALNRSLDAAFPAP